MQHITLSQAGKRFNKDWIFKSLDFTFEMGKQYALIGNNGSGKSTLLQIISGYTNLTKGTIDWDHFDTHTIYTQLSLAAPYLELVEEFTTLEQIDFHQSFKPLMKQLSIDDMIEMIGLKEAKHKQIRHFSSGMKQRLKLALAILSDTPLLLLDEPCSNLDKSGYQLYQNMIATYAMHKLIIVGSNDPEEYQFCGQQINLMDYKN